MHRWRFEPLDPGRFPVGMGPFRARGLAYVHALRYVDTRLPGGRKALSDRLGPGDPFAPFFDQIFLVTGDYDVSPLVRLFMVAAAIKGADLGTFIRRRASRSGGDDARGVWKPALHGANAAEVASRLHFAFARYFPPCTAETLGAAPGRFEGELRGLPACMDGLYAECTVGFYEGALGDVGAHDIQVAFERPHADGARDGVALERVRFAVRWQEQG